MEVRTDAGAASEAGTNWWSMLWKALLTVWSLLPQEKKDRIINAIVESFSEIIGAFWDKWVRRKLIVDESGVVDGSLEAAT